MKVRGGIFPIGKEKGKYCYYIQYGLSSKSEIFLGYIFLYVFVRWHPFTFSQKVEPTC